MSETNGRPALTWTPERLAVLVRDWPTERARVDIEAEIEALPGAPIWTDTLHNKAMKLGLQRPECVRRSHTTSGVTDVWSAEALDALRLLWSEGHSASEIGRRQGRSKNAIVGKVHRLGLASRPSPIIRDPAGSPPRVRGPRTSRRSALPKMERPATPRPRLTIAPPKRPVVYEPIFAAPPRLSGHPCVFPFGDPGTKAFRFCGDPALAGKPYCGACCRVAYVRVVDRREDVAA